MGRIVAGLTHEMRNVLAIVKESSGLIEDLLESARLRNEGVEDRLRRALSGIRRQVSRGTELSDRLNRFAHTLDEPELSLPPNEIARLVVLLMRRSARSSQVDLAFRESPAASPGGPVPSRFLLAACACVERFLEDSPGGGTLEVHPEGASSGVSLRVFWREEQPGSGPSGDRPSAPPGWDGILSEIGATLDPLPDAGGGGIRISVGRRD